ncbi:antiviral reverse transcriptase Drt3a [Pseudomonas sp. NPDC088368]|uniref:antiviral reverse transcriptase Drt3a n=1 Tax=Pseudomonas sp. NPDC088368 TaxID=3364453 RepID=UPI0038280333
MANQAFSFSGLARCLSDADFYEEKRLSEDDFRKAVIEHALQLCRCTDEDKILIKKIKIGNKTGYTAGNLASKLVLRKCNINIHNAFRIKMSNRQAISREIPAYLRDGTPYRVYRLDIKSFFENISATTAIRELECNQLLSPHTKNVVRHALQGFKACYGSGVPRGVETSSALAELLLSDFDRKLKDHEEVFYFSRFVDDIIVITSSSEDQQGFYQWLCDILPPPLSYNPDKTKIHTVSKRKKAGAANPDGKQVLKFGFLGYSYSVYDTPLPKKNNVENESTAGSIYRKVVIDIDDKKIRTIKEKISKALYSYSKNYDFNLLHDRIRFLTSNRELKDKDGNKKISTGIYYSYASIDPKSASLKTLDVFLEQALCNTTGRLGKTFSQKITQEQKSILLKLTFRSGFGKRAHRKFSPNRLKEITRIWS